MHFQLITRIKNGPIAIGSGIGAADTKANNSFRWQLGAYIVRSECVTGSGSLGTCSPDKMDDDSVMLMIRCN